jgi:hypothetical protein
VEFRGLFASLMGRSGKDYAAKRVRRKQAFRSPFRMHCPLLEDAKFGGYVTKYFY